jgi:DNA-directed RNA polymerase subunit RPC12/RpoP
MKPSKTYNLSVVNPGLASEWNLVKNGHLKPEDITPGSGKKIWWICKKAHEWQAVVANRTNGNGCPYCSGRRVTKDNCLKTKNPSIARQWHPVKNGDLTPEDVTPGSHKKIWWVCEKGHEWQASVKNRNYGRGCPYCSGKRVNQENCLKTKNPSLARQWHPLKNRDLTPEDVTTGSNKKVWWLCAKSHEWKEVIASRNKGVGCPYCAGKRATKDNCLKTKNPLIASEWHPLKNGNLKPVDVVPSSNKRVWWLCVKGHEWQVKIYDRTADNTRCPYCMQKSAEYKLTITNPVLAEMWHPEKNGNLTPPDVTANSTNNVWWLCKKGHEWREKVYLQDRSEGCPLCHKDNPHKKFKNRFGSIAFRGFYKPRVQGNGSQSFPLSVKTTFEEKKTIRKKGKIKEYRKKTSYARYVYGLDRIPEGWVIWHIDGDPLNNNLENLECISRSELLRRNSMNKDNKNP